MWTSKLFLAISVLGLAMLPNRGFAITNAVVGTCLKGTQFTSIQAAVNNASAGSTVKVCPGTYPEQIKITTDLTLTAVTSALNNSVTIAQPAGGVQDNALSGIFGNLAVQLFVQNAIVTINGIAVDGTIPTGAACPSAAHWVGIMYQGGGGVLSNSTVVNPPACGSLSAFFDVTNSMQVTNNQLFCESTCLEVDYSDGATVVSGNVLSGAGTSTTLQGIELQNLNTPATVSNNFLTAINSAIFFNVTSGSTVTGNTLVSDIAGIVLQSTTKTVVQNNHIDFTFAAIAIADQGAGGNTVTKNTINRAVIAIYNAPSTGDVLTPNSIYNTQTLHN